LGGIGKGRVFLIGSPLDGEASDLPAKPAFVVLLERLRSLGERPIDREGAP